MKGKGEGRRGKGVGEVERDREEGRRGGGLGLKGKGGGLGERGVDYFMGAGTANPFFLTLRKPEVAEKYLAFVSSPRRSAAEGFTISRPCNR